MKVLIMGCGRVGAQLASMMDTEKHEVTVLDVNGHSFRRLSSTFGGTALLGDGTDSEVLKKAGVESTDAFVAVTEGDNRNLMAAQIAKYIFNVPKVICRIYDPLRAEIYHNMGLETYCPTLLGANAIKTILTSISE